jgi:hypothetical protein
MIGSSGRWPIWDMRSQTVGNVLRRHGIPPAPERKRRTTWAGIIRILLALLAGTDITCYVLFSIYLESSRIDISRITNCPTVNRRSPTSHPILLSQVPLKFAMQLSSVLDFF